MATTRAAAEEPLSLPTVRVIHDNIVKVANMVGDLKADVATKDDIAAVNERLDRLGEGFNTVVETLTLIAEWMEGTDERLDRMDGRLAGVEGSLDDVGTTVRAMYEHLAGPLRDEIDEHMGGESDD